MKIALAALAVAATVSATAQDTVHHRLEEVQVTTQRTPATLRTVAPTQVMDAGTLEEQGVIQLSDAVKMMAGVTLKDYGGIGGMKTVSARGLGSQFSTVTIDGVAVDNSQNGQVDLGRYMTGNAAFVSLSQGQQNEPLLSARAYAAGNVLNMETAEPVFFGTGATNMKVGTEAGSFGMFSPALTWEQKWGRRLKTSLWANWLQSDGDYPFTLYHTNDHSGTTSRERRNHSAMHMLTVDANLFYTIDSANTLTAKVHYLGGMHQLPGQVILGSSRVSAQSTHEEALLMQARWRMERSRWRLQVLGKVQDGTDQYEDSMAIGYMNNYMENHYHQREGYVSASAVWAATRWLDLSLAADADGSHLRSNLARRNDVTRTSLLAVLAARAHFGGVEARANLLATDVSDRVVDLDTMPRYRCLSPYAAVMYTPVPGLTLRYFYKETFRVPNFSELYFFLSIPRNLRPERAMQHNIGATWSNGRVGATLDGYFNRVVDKIIAKPGSNMFYWTMENLGLVHILGVDATMEFRVSNLEFRGNYSFAHAVDLSDPTDEKTYGYQIRYTPRHSGGATVRWESEWVNLGASAMVVGHRYAYQQNNDASRMPAYCDVGLSADRRFNLRSSVLFVKAQVFNLFDVQYEVVRYYPMMGRNFRIGITYEF